MPACVMGGGGESGIEGLISFRVAWAGAYTVWGATATSRGLCLVSATARSAAFLGMGVGLGAGMSSGAAMMLVIAAKRVRKELSPLLLLLRVFPLLLRLLEGDWAGTGWGAGGARLIGRMLFLALLCLLP